jgi:hypothetical protein
VNPYIVVDGAERLIDFLVEVFGGVEQGRSLRPDGRIEHGDPPPTVPAWPRAQPRSWPLPIDPGAIVAAASSTHSTIGGGSRPISETFPDRHEHPCPQREGAASPTSQIHNY